MSNHWDKPSRRDRRAKPKTREPKQLQTHLFVPSGVFVRTGRPDEPSQEICGRDDCGMPRWFRAHDLPDTSDAQVLTSRMIGEGSEE